MSAKDEEPLSLPVGWITMELGDLCIWGSGGTPKRSEPSFFGGDIPWVTISDLGDAVLTSTTETITQSGLTSSAAKLISPNSVLVALYGSIGKLGLTTRQVTTNQAIAHAVPEPSIYESRYLFYFLMARRGDLANLGSGVTQKNIYLGDLKSFKIWVAPRAEQTRIVDKLEELLSDLNAGVAELKAAQKKLALYRQSLLKAAVEGTLTADWRARRATRGEALETGADLLARILTERRARWEARQLAKFKEQGKTPPKGWQAKYPEPIQPDTSRLPTLPSGWTWATIDQLAVVVRGASPRPAGDPRYFGGSIPWITVGSLTCDDGIYLDEVDLFVTEAGKSASRYIEPNTLLLTNSGATLGVPKITRIGGCINDGSVALLDLATEVQLYLYFFLTTQTAKLRALNQGAAQPNLNTDIVRRIVVPVCPDAEMRAITEKLTQATLDVKIQDRNIFQALRQSTAQRKNLLKAAFSGQLVPQDPNDEPASALLARIRAERAASGHNTRRQRQKQETP